MWVGDFPLWSWWGRRWLLGQRQHLGHTVGFMGGKVVADAVFLLAFAESFGAGWRGEWLSAQEALITGHVPVSG